jgi:hypothetical protein
MDQFAFGQKNDDSRNAEQQESDQRPELMNPEVMVAGGSRIAGR